MNLILKSYHPNSASIVREALPQIIKQSPNGVSFAQIYACLREFSSVSESVVRGALAVAVQEELCRSVVAGKHNARLYFPPAKRVRSVRHGRASNKPMASWFGALVTQARA
jgi:hypothetical protein